MCLSYSGGILADEIKCVAIQLPSVLVLPLKSKDYIDIKAEF